MVRVGGVRARGHIVHGHRLFDFILFNFLFEAASEHSDAPLERNDDTFARRIAEEALVEVIDRDRLRDFEFLFGVWVARMVCLYHLLQPLQGKDIGTLDSTAVTRGDPLFYFLEKNVGTYKFYHMLLATRRRFLLLYRSVFVALAHVTSLFLFLKLFFLSEFSGLAFMDQRGRVLELEVEARYPAAIEYLVAA